MDRELTKEEKIAKEYEKFQRKVARITPYAHEKRVFSRMLADKAKEDLAKKASAIKKKSEE